MLNSSAFSFRLWFPLTVALACTAGACGSSDSSDASGTGGTDDAGVDATADSTPADDAAQDATSEPPVDLPDGTPTRQACTEDFGHGLTQRFGRLDGFLVSIVAPSSNHDCNADTEHLHLQVLMKGAVYDVSVNVADSSSDNTPVKIAELDAPNLNGQWSEGWHTTDISFDYTDDLKLHSPFFASMGTTELANKIEDAVQDANHISVYATGYGDDGLHLVHREGGGEDGALVIKPLSAAPHVLAFCFADQGF